MERVGGGSIILVSSIWGKVGTARSHRLSGDEGRRQTFLGEGGKRFIGMTQPWDFEGGSAHLSSD
jgi:hypothetical protein